MLNSFTPSRFTLKINVCKVASWCGVRLLFAVGVVAWWCVLVRGVPASPPSKVDTGSHPRTTPPHRSPLHPLPYPRLFLVVVARRAEKIFFLSALVGGCFVWFVKPAFA